MYALILAGGKGERLRPLTDSVPKPMVPVCDKPILLHQVEWLRLIGVTDVVFLVGYRWQIIQDFFGDGSEFGIQAHYSVEDSPLVRNRITDAQVRRHNAVGVVLSHDESVGQPHLVERSVG